VHVVGIDGRETAPWENSTSLPTPAPSEWTLAASASEVEVRAAGGAPGCLVRATLGVISPGSHVSPAASPDGRHWAVVINGVVRAFALNP
jgi:hypothetical protein